MVSFILPGNSATGGYEVANSVRLNNADNAYFSQTPSASSGTTFTYSMWIKRGRIGLNGYLIRMVAADNSESDLVIESDKIRIQEYEGTSGTNKWKYITNRLFRDASAWYHIMYVVDTNNGTASDRVQLYINGVRETSFSTATNPSSGATSALSKGEARTFGGKASAGSFDGYMAECVYVDGTAKSTTDFGEFDEDSPTIWKPIDVSSMSLGSTGWYLDFEDSSSLGNDASGSNNWTSNNLAAIDQSLDTCTNNYNILNPFLMSSYESQLSDGNLQTAASDVRGRFHNIGTIGFDSGKYYAEFKMTGGTYQTVGVCTEASFTTASTLIQSGLNYLGQSNSLSYIYYVSDGDVWANGTITSVGDTLATDDILGVYVDLDNHKLYFSKNGTLQSSTGISLPTGYTYFFAVGDLATGSTATVSCNFGSPAYSISSSNTDDNGHGNFEYSPNITGDGSAKSFYALNTKNLAEFG